MTRLNRHYLVLLIAYGLLGPLLPALALFLMNDSQLLRQEWPRWAEVLGVYCVIGLAPALITGALVWALGLRHNRQGLNLTLTIALLLTVVQAICLSRDWGDFSAVLLTSALMAGLLYRHLPQPTADYRPVAKLQRHYGFLFLGFTVLGPLLPWLYLQLLLGDPNDSLLDWKELSAFLIGSYGFGLLPDLLTGALVWRLKLRSDLKGNATTLGLAFLLSALYGVMSHHGDLENAALGFCGIFTALSLCPYLPRPEAASPTLNASLEQKSLLTAGISSTCLGKD